MPNKTASMALYLTTIVLGIVALLGAVTLARRSEWRAYLLGLLGLPLVPWLAGLSQRVGGETCGWFALFGHYDSCNRDAVITGTVFGATVLILLVGLLFGGMLHLLREARWGPAVFMAAGLAVTLGLAGASWLAIQALDGTAARAVVANQPRYTPSLGLIALCGTLTALAALARRRGPK